MKREIYEYLTDSFLDYAGKQHHIVLCAISSSPQDNNETLSVGWIYDEQYVATYRNLYEVVRSVSIGVAICHPEDIFNVNTGMKIAYSKAKESGEVLFSAKAGIINKTLIMGLLSQEAEFIANNPGMFITNYHKNKTNYEQQIIAEKELLNITNDEGTVIQAIIDGVNLEKCERLAKLQIKKLNELAKTM